MMTAQARKQLIADMVEMAGRPTPEAADFAFRKLVLVLQENTNLRQQLLRVSRSAA
jgi:hypothetical protein